MPETVKVPGIGAVKRPYLYAGAAITAGILAIAYWRNANSGGDASGADAVDADAGYALGSEASGYNTVYPPVGYASQGDYAPYGYDIYGNPLPKPTGATGEYGTFASNSDWTAAAVELLQDGGVVREKASEAITRVLGGLTVTVDQQSMFLRAVGTLGKPPQGYPPIKLVDSGGQPKPPPPPGKTQKPPNLRVTSVGRTTINIDWSDVTGAQGYEVWLEGSRRNTTRTSSYRFARLRPGTKYSIGVKTRTASGVSGMSVVHATTRK